MRRLLHIAGVVAATFLLVTATASADGLTYSGSLGVANGDYTLTEETTSFVLLNGLAWTRERWRVSVSLPVIHQDTPYVTYAGGVAVPTGRRFSQQPNTLAVASRSGVQAGVPSGSVGQGRQERDGKVVVPDPESVDFDETGMGDPLLRIDLRLGDAASGALGLFAGLKAPIADDQGGFGTGEWDFGGGLTFGVAAGAGRLFGELGFWIYGDSELYDFDDPLVASVGYAASFDERWSWLASIFAASESFDDADGPAEASLAVQRAFVGGHSLSLTLGVGLTETAPDVRLTLGWSSSL